jgi:Flp pilus assembly protein TadG
MVRILQRLHPEYQALKEPLLAASTWAESKDMRSRKQRGAALVEFALVLPLLLLLVFGIIEFGLVLYDKTVITNASREAARYGIVWAPTKPTVSEIQAVAANYCSTYLISLGSNSNGCPAPNVTGAGGPFGQPLTVTVSYPFASLALGKMISPFTGTLTLSATTTMNNE